VYNNSYETISVAQCGAAMAQRLNSPAPATGGGGGGGLCGGGGSSSALGGDDDEDDDEEDEACDWSRDGLGELLHRQRHTARALTFAASPDHGRRTVSPPLTAVAPAGAPPLTLAVSGARSPARSVGGARHGSARPLVAQGRMLGTTAEAEELSTDGLRAVWELVYRRTCNSHHRVYLLRAVVYPGVRPRAAAHGGGSDARRLAPPRGATSDDEEEAGEEEDEDSEDEEEEDEEEAAAEAAPSPSEGSGSDDFGRHLVGSSDDDGVDWGGQSVRSVDTVCGDAAAAETNEEVEEAAAPWLAQTAVDDFDVASGEDEEAAAASEADTASAAAAAAERDNDDDEDDEWAAASVDTETGAWMDGHGRGDEAAAAEAAVEREDARERGDEEEGGEEAGDVEQRRHAFLEWRAALVATRRAALRGAADDAEELEVAAAAVETEEERIRTEEREEAHLEPRWHLDQHATRCAWWESTGEDLPGAAHDLQAWEEAAEAWELRDAPEDAASEEREPVWHSEFHARRVARWWAAGGGEEGDEDEEERSEAEEGVGDELEHELEPAWHTTAHAARVRREQG
jgi:hypothetical protein